MENTGDDAMTYALLQELHVSNANAEFAILTLASMVIPEAVGEVFNLASEIETKVIDIASMVNEITGNPNRVEFVAQRDWGKNHPETGFY